MIGLITGTRTRASRRMSPGRQRAGLLSLGLLLTAAIAWYVRKGRAPKGAGAAGARPAPAPVPAPVPATPVPVAPAPLRGSPTIVEAEPPPKPAPPRAEPLSSEERLALRSVRSLETRGSTPTRAEVATHLASGTEVEVDEEALGRMLQRFADEGLIEDRSGGCALTSAGTTALTGLDDDTSHTGTETDAVELHPPGSDGASGEER